MYKLQKEAYKMIREMKSKSIYFQRNFFLLFSTLLCMLFDIANANNDFDLTARVANPKIIQEDLLLILNKGKLSPNTISFSRNTKSLSNNNHVSFSCNQNRIHLEINSTNEEWSSTLYFGLQKMGFLFPHPRVQITPKLDSMMSLCGQIFKFDPAFQFRGFHLHTMHPNEWMIGFLMGKSNAAEEIVRWHARNGQNVMTVHLLRQKMSVIKKNVTENIKLAQDLGISFGFSIGFALNQQKSYKLIPLLSSLTGIGDKAYIKKNLNKLIKELPFDFLSMDAGTSEFTSVNYKRALSWMELASEILQKNDKKLFMKIHVSSNQTHPTYGNFNYLPKFTKTQIGILPHTVMFYSLYDEKVPMYGNKNFHELREFTKSQNKLRSTWYFPESSYWIAMDMDVPLLLTDYLIARAEDMKELSKENIEGHLTFTSGHENGYWLFDWTIALNTHKGYNFDPQIALKLLGEDSSCWENHLNYQNEFFKKKMLISILSAPNLQDEVVSKHKIHERNLVRELYVKNDELIKELALLNSAFDQIPDTSCIQHEELKLLLDITYGRIKHALLTRNAIKEGFDRTSKMNFIRQAEEVRNYHTTSMSQIIEYHQKYKELNLYERFSNPTSYSFGYLWPSKNLHFWKVEEERIRRDRLDPFFMNIYNFWRIIF